MAITAKDVMELRKQTDCGMMECKKALTEADGKVLIAQNMYFAGNTVYLDHGQGVISTYAHMSRLDVKPGESVKAGQQIGLVGATGRVTGPHLHLGVNILGVAVDPLSLVPQH